ncbi:MAG: MerR family transcriptional regulator [Chloroflexota bacterium]|nr:MerR family transcriptional regulator [Chloroflexota bacterium]
MLIGELAERTGVTPRTIRYYEGLGLLRPGDRTAGGFRRYGDEHVARLQVIDRLKALGLTLGEVAEVIDLYFEDLSGTAGKRKVIEILEGHLRDTEAKIAELRRFHDELRANLATMRRYLAEAEAAEPR